MHQEVAVPGKYGPLTDALRAAAARGQAVVDFDFSQVADLVGGLPASATTRQWWANSSHSQALAWRDAGYHVETVYLDRRRVRFARGEVGGSYHDQGSRTVPRTSGRFSTPVRREPRGEPLDVRVQFQWHDAGIVTLDAFGKLTFPRVEAVPGLYQMVLPGVAGPTPQVYIGETDNLRRRLHTNYRTPGAAQATSLRINALLIGHLNIGGTIELAVATEATVWLNNTAQPLDLTRKAARLLAENAALVLAQATSTAAIVNLG